MRDALKSKIEAGTAKVGVIGLGYVGLPLAVELAKAGFSVAGFDTSAERVEQVNRGKSYIGDVSDTELAAVTGVKGRLRASTDGDVLAGADCVSVCVPTPLGKTRDPDISFILSARDRLKKHFHPGMLVVLESTTYPGTTEEIFVPAVTEAGLTPGKDFFLAFSPERIDPGNKKFRLANTPKVVGGITPACTEIAAALYRKIVSEIVPVGSARAAEMVKILENTYRAVNIGLVNEVAIMCRILGVDTWEVIDAAATKPFGFTPFYPGPGLGGHCIPVDPQYLSWKLKTLNYNARFIDLAAEVNASMPAHVAEIAGGALLKAGKKTAGSKILLLGVTYKADVSDIRESPALDIFKLLEEQGARVSYNDPHVPSFQINGRTVSSVELTPEAVAAQDLVVITAFHAGYDLPRILEHARLVLDTRNAAKGLRSPKIIRL